MTFWHSDEVGKPPGVSAACVCIIVEMSWKYYVLQSANYLDDASKLHAVPEAFRTGCLAAVRLCI